MFEKKPEAMKKISIKEKIAFNFIFNEKRVYHRWYGRWFVFGLDYGRLKRVIPRINNWFEWCREWDREGMDNIKEAENHFFGQAVAGAGMNFLTFDGPGQAELWQDMKFDLDYHKAVHLQYSR